MIGHIGKSSTCVHWLFFVEVNHHNQTVAFASALVANKNEHMYAWFLYQFLVAMKVKAPSCLITDEDQAMKNAIEKVLPKAKHQLCAWHLIQNATNNVGNQLSSRNACLQIMKLESFGIGRNLRFLSLVLKIIMGSMTCMKTVKCGQWHVFMATSLQSLG